MWKTPASYRDYPGGDSLPDELKVWRVQKTKNNFGIVLSPEAWKAVKDCEILVPGFNKSKGNGAVAVGRYKNLLYWGFSGSPSQMNEAGKNLFLNCIYYMLERGKK